MELQRLSAYIKSRERPTLVLYFGDHLPGLGHVYQDLEFDNGLGARQQKTPFLLFSNYPLHITSEPTLDIAAWQLATLTLKVADLLGDGAFAWFDALYEQQKWSQETAEECQTTVCDALLQFQYQQLAGPKSEPSGPPPRQGSHLAK